MSERQQDPRQTSLDAAALRKRAEEQAKPMEQTSMSAQTPEEIQRIFHELRVHQIELEMQNEELRTAQIQIEAGRARYFDLYDLAPVGYCTISEKGIILEANLTATSLLGVSRGAQVKQALTRFILKEDQDIYYLHRKKLFETGESQRFELRLFKPDGSVFWAHLTWTVAQAAGDAPVCRVVLIDITERKKAEEDLRVAEQFYKDTLDGLSSHIAVINEVGQIVLTNKAYRDFAERNKIEYRAVSEGCNYLAVCDAAQGEDSEAAGLFAQGIRDVLSGKRPFFEQEYPCHSPVEQRWFIGRVTPLTGGSPVRAVIAHENITKRKLAEKAAKVNAYMFQSLFDEMPTGAAIYKVLNDGAFGKDYMIQDFNKAALKAERKEKVEVLGRSLYDLRPNIDQYGLIRVFQNVWLTGEPADYPTKLYVDENFSNYYENRVYKLPSGEIVAIFEDVTVKKQAEDSVIKQNALFATLLKLLPVGVLMVDVEEGRPLIVNDLGMTFLGNGILPDANEHNLSEVHKAYKRDTQKHYPTAEMPIKLGMKGISAHIDDMVVERPDGTRILLEVFGTPVVDDQGEPWASLVTFMDITERKRAEDEISFLKNKYELVLSSTYEGIIGLDEQGNHTFINSAAAKMLGYESEVLIGRPAHSLWHHSNPDGSPYPIEACKIHHADVTANRMSQSEEVFWKKDGTSIPVEYSSTPVYVKDQLAGSVITFTDITERKKAEDAIKVEAERYNALIESTKDWIWVVDSENYKLTLFNSAIARYFERNHGVILKAGMSPDEMFSEHRSGLWKVFYNKAKCEGRFSEEYSIVSENLHFLLSFARLINDDRIVGISVFAKNITNETKYREQLESSNKMLVHRLQQSIKTISKIGEIRDAYTAGHQKKVAELSTAIARQMRLSDEVIRNISDGALIHDIGKIYIASDILNKPGKISDLEFQLIQTHVDHSYNIVKDIDFSSSVKEMIRQHHERMDGTGYPDKLTGDQIIIESRILAVADVVEAMSSHRPYRPALGIDVALEEISKYKGEKYDCAVVDACIQLFREKGFKFSER